MGYGLHPCSNRLKSSQLEQVEGCRPQRCHRSGTVAPVAMVVLVQLGVTDPVPAFNAPAVPHQLKQDFLGAQAGVAPRGSPGEALQVGGLERLAVMAAGGVQLNDPAGADPGFCDVLRCLFGPQLPGDVTAMAFLVIPCLERDLALSLKLTADLAVEGFLVGYHCQEEVGSLLLEQLKNGRCVCRASAWISTPSRSSSPSSCFSTARSWFSPVA